MSRGFVLKGIVLPLVCALLSCAVLFALINANADSFFPVADNAVLAYHDKLNPSEQPVAGLSGGLKSDDLIGSVKGEGELPLRYDTGYSNLADCASLSTESAEFGKTGCIYIKVSAGTVSRLNIKDKITVSTPDGSFTYKLSGEQTADSESAVLSLAPAQKQSLIVYYRVSAGIGLTTDYNVLIFKGVD